MKFEKKNIIDEKQNFKLNNNDPKINMHFV